MYAYLIIAAELAILYTVFWYIFLREPRPYKVSRNIWGNYDGAEPIKVAPGQNMYEYLMTFSQDGVEHGVDKSSESPTYRMKPFHASAELKYGWVIEEKRRLPKNAPQDVFTKLVYCVARLAQLSVKLP